MKKVLQFCLTVNSFKLFKGGCKKGSSLPGRLRTSRSCITIDSPPNSGSDHCFLNCLVGGIARVSRNPSRWCAQYSEIERLLLLCWPDKCSFPVTSRHWKSIDTHCLVSVNIYGHEKGVVFPVFLSTYRDSKPFHVDMCNTFYFQYSGCHQIFDFGCTGNQGTLPVVATIYLKSNKSFVPKETLIK